MVTVDGAHLTGPTVRYDQIAFSHALKVFTFAIDYRGFDAEQRAGRGSRLEWCGSWQRADQNAPRLRLPPGVNDGATLFAHDMVVPLPRLRIDRLANSTQQAQALARRSFDRIISFAHQGANRGRRCITDIDLVLVADFPESRCRRVVGYALEHQRDRAVRQRTVDNVAMPGDPADVSRAPVYIAGPIVEHVLVSHCSVNEIAAGRVQDTFRFAG